jgi:uncharacterized protein (TIGR03083 family)
LLRSLSPDEWNAATECPNWNVKEIALHVLGDDLSLLSRQRDEATNGLLLYAVDHPGLTFPALLDGFNEQWVKAAGFLSTELVVKLLEMSGVWTAVYYGTVDRTELGEPVGFFGAAKQGGQSPLWQAIAREYVERWIHQSQIRRALGHAPVADDLSAPGVEVVVLGFGARNDELGRFTIGDRSWDFGPGPEVALDPALATRVLSRGEPMEATMAALSGEPSVVRTIAEQTCLHLRLG